MTKTETHLKEGTEVLFDNLIMANDDLITTSTAALLAKELGIDGYDPTNYDH